MKRVINKVMQNLVDLDFDKKAYITHFEYAWFSKNKKCQICKGEGVFTRGKNVYRCLDCSGTGKVGEYKPTFVVSCINPREEYFSIKNNMLEMSMYKDIRGIFNTKKKAFDLAKELNGGKNVLY